MKVISLMRIFSKRYFNLYLKEKGKDKSNKFKRKLKKKIKANLIKQN